MSNKPMNVEVANVNGHLHTPFSFSAFETIPQALDLAVNEDVKVVGINDFNTTSGYAEWQAEALKRKLFPLFNIEIISLNSEDQAAAIRVNDPNNPGRTYFSGKGLTCPLKIQGMYGDLLKNIFEESNAHVGRMCVKLNQLLETVGAGFSLDFETIKQEMTKGSIRERHLAKALRLKVEEKFGNDTEAKKCFYEKIFSGKPLKSDVSNSAAVENEIRGNLLKAGGGAFVPENPKAFLPMETVRQLILAAGGIPTYPFLADDAKGGFTDFENDIERCAGILNQRGVYAAEFITTRNSIAVLEQYAGYLFDHGFVVTFGTEHNTPAMEPLKLKARGSVELTEKLRYINYCGACIIAAHQDKLNRGEKGYLDENGCPNLALRDDFIAYGNKLIHSVID